MTARSQRSGKKSETERPPEKAVGWPYLPDRSKLEHYLDRVYRTGRLTNNGPLVQELEQRLSEHLGVSNLLLVANGTLALQLAFRVLKLKGEAVTTPFTFAATSGALRWQGVQPRYADIDSAELNLDPGAIAERINARTSAIVPVHVYGNPCRVDAIREIADRHELPVVYDASHAFGVRRDGESVLQAGDISTISFHATKLFHTVEGGGVVFADRAHYERARRMINFGLDDGGGIGEAGINAKMSEFHAAMGLAVLDDIDHIMDRRTALAEEYRRCLTGHVGLQRRIADDNGAYMPILPASTDEADRIERTLREEGIRPRRYFFPALHEAEAFRNGDDCPVASDAAKRVLSLPLYPKMSIPEVRWIADRIRSAIE